MRRLHPLVLMLAVVLLLAGCGGAHHATHRAKALAPIVAPQPQCTPQDVSLQCILQEQPPPLPILRVGAPAIGYGIDFAWSCPPPGPAGFGGSNYTFGASYLSYDASKNWSRACVNEWHSRGAATVAVWESGATEATNGYAAGRSDAGVAAAQAAYLGEPLDRPIFFAIDCDCSTGQVISYFQGVASRIGVARTGAYGGYWPITGLIDAGAIRYGWQTYAWSGGRWDSRAHLEQYLNSNAVDYDRAIAADYGQWPYTPPPPPLRCFGSHAAVRNATCKRVRAEAARWTRARASSQRAYQRRGCRVLAQRSGWFAARLRQHPRVKTVTRKRALAATEKAYRQRSCAMFSGRAGYYAAKISAVERRYG